MSIYRYICCDLVTNNVLEELPFRQVRFERLLNDVGTFTGRLPIADPAIASVQRAVTATQPGRTALYVDRDGALVWGGIVVTRNYAAGQNAPVGVDPNSIEIGASEFMWYFAQKRIIAATRNYSSQDQLFIAQDLINYAQSVRGGSIGVVVPSSTSGVLRTQTYNPNDRKKVGQAVMDLSQLDNGFDWAIDLAYDVNGNPVKTLSLGYPRRGAPYGSTGWIFEYPGNIVDYSWPEDSSLQAITAYVQGSGTGSNMVVSSDSNTALIDGGYPLLEDTFSAKDQTDPSLIAARATAAVKAYSNPVTLPQLLVRADGDPLLGAYTQGDDARVRITDARFPAVGSGPGLDTYLRIIGIRVEPQDGTSAERVYLTMGAVPP